MIHTSFNLPHVDVRACRGLWSAVLFAVLRDLCASDARSGDRHAAERWVGAWPGQDFRLVCHLAGLDPACVHDTLSGLIRLPVRERRKTAARKLGCKASQIGNALIMRNSQSERPDTEPEGQDAASPVDPTLRRDTIANRSNHIAEGHVT